MNQEIIDCVQKIIENQKDECQWNDKLAAQMDFESFQKILMERSAIIRKYYAKNEELFAAIYDYMEGPLDEEKAETLFEAARQTILTGRLDPPLTMLLSKKLIDYFIATDNKERAICTIIFYGTATQDYYVRAEKTMFFEDLSHYYEWVIDNSIHYCSYTDVRARNNTILSFVNYIMLLVDTENPKYFDKSVQLYAKLHSMWFSEEVQNLDGDNENVKYLYEINSYYALLEMCEYCISVAGNIDEQVMGWLKEVYIAHKEDPDWQKTTKSIEIRMENMNHNINSAQTVHRWEYLLDEIPTPDWSGDIKLAQEIFELSSDVLILALSDTNKTTHMSPEEKEKTAISLLYKYERFIENLPYVYLESYVNAVYRQIFSCAVPCVIKMDYKEKIFYELLIRRQPSTLLHSRMVEEISLKIADEILNQRPEIFLSLPLYNCVEELLEHKEELLEIIARGARLHDAGKCNIASVIMQQSRKLTDDEFLLIKSHPSKGADFFKGTENFEIYEDIIRGHHKNYDGTWGYPAEFDNTASPYRILVDLISISDSTDAATDILGRNYAAGKDFYHLLEELKEGAGSRYNPDIVQVIANSPKLQAELAELTGSMRIGYCYEAYRDGTVSSF